MDAARIRTPRWSIGAAARAAAICLLAAGLSAQTAVKPPKNKYTPQQDVELGREAAAEVRKQYPVVDNERIARYLGTVGDRLLEAAPPDLDEPVFEYSFTPVNLKEINAFALPGGPMFINRGLVDAAASEAELAGVMAHELAHVLLRHGTANASKAQNPWLQLGQIAGVIGGAVVGGAKGEAIAQGSQFGLGTLLLKYSREYQKQADLLGVQIMARAGYDPRALGQMFETIERASKSSGGSGPQWMSSHPNPGNRTQYINQEADALTVASTPDTSGFETIKPVFASLPPPKPMRGAARADAAEDAAAPTGTPGQPLPPPAEQYPGDQRRQSLPGIGSRQLDSAAVEQRDQGRAGERVRPAQRADGVRVRRRVRRRAGRLARPRAGHRRLARRGGAEQSRSAAGRRPAGDPDLRALRPCHAPRQSVADGRA